MIKKVFVMCLAAVLAICFAAPGTFAGSEGGVCADGLFWSLDGGVLTISGSGDMKDYNLEKSPWYEYSESIDEIIIENGVTSIGACAFSEPVETSGGGIEEGGEIGLNSVCDGAKKITIADSVRKIGALAFYNCSALREIKMPANVSSVGKWAFRNCALLSDVYYENTLQSWNAISIGDKNQALTNAKLHYIVKYGECGDSLNYKLDSDGNLSIYGEGEMYDYSYKASPWYDYINDISSISVEDNVTKIGSYAFADISNTENINIPYSVKAMGESAFYGCNFTYMYVPSRFKASQSEWLDNSQTEVSYYALCEGVALDVNQKYLQAGETLELTPIFTPEDTTNKKVSWVSDNEEIASVKDGIVTAKKNGSAKITVITDDGGFEASCDIDVITKATGIEIASSADVLYMKETLLLKANVLPGDATNQKVSWKSSDEDVLRVDANGNVTPCKNGEAVVYAYVNETPDENSAVFEAQKKITVQTRVEGVELDVSKMSLLTKEQKTLNMTIYPQTATNKKVSWKSSDENVIKVDENGNITAVGEGEAKVTVITDDGGFEASCEIDVKDYRMTAKEYDGGFDINIKTLLENDAKILVASYDSNGKFLNLNVYPFSEDVTGLKKNDGETVKIMLFSDLENIIPLTEFVVLNN